MRSLLLSALLVLAGAASSFAQPAPSAEDVANAQYLGVRACRPCHMSALQGEMYKKWEAGPHAKAFEVLASDSAKTLAASLNIANPQESADCLACHSTVGRVDASRVHARFDVSEGVGCESCHGPGEFYRKKPVMCEITSGELEGSAVGLIAPDEATCMGCHGGDMPEGHPAAEFNFEEAVQQVSHPLPADRANGQGCKK